MREHRECLTKPTEDKTPDERAKLLETTEIFATAHATAASGGQSRMPEGLKANDHFIAFVHAPDGQDPTKSRLVQLDGRRSKAIDIGESTDLLKASLFLRLYNHTLTSLTGCRKVYQGDVYESHGCRQLLHDCVRSCLG